MTMTTLYRKIAFVFLQIIVLVKASHLRSTTTTPQHEQTLPHRELQLAATVLNALTTMLTPAIVQTVQDDMAAFYDPVYLGQETKIDVDDLNLGTVSDSCASTSSSSSSSSNSTEQYLIVTVGNLTGLGSIDIQRMELVPGTEDIQVSFLGLDGATWSGTWLMNASFTNVVMDMNVTVPAGTCNSTSDEIIPGTATFGNPSFQIILVLEGETSNLLQFVSTSQVTTARVTSVEFDMGPYEIVLQDSSSLDQFDTQELSLDNLLLDDFSTVVEPILLNISNEALAEELPYQFS